MRVSSEVMAGWWSCAQDAAQGMSHLTVLWHVFLGWSRLPCLCVRKGFSDLLVFLYTILPEWKVNVTSVLQLGLFADNTEALICLRRASYASLNQISLRMGVLWEVSFGTRLAAQADPSQLEVWVSEGDVPLVRLPHSLFVNAVVVPPEVEDALHRSRGPCVTDLRLRACVQ